MILSWLLRLFKRHNPNVRRLVWPTREEIAALAPFEGLTATHITEVRTGHDAERVQQALMGETAVGFDTESKPTFVRGQVSTGPHVVQFSTTQHAYVFTLERPEIRKVVCALLHAKELKKVGFGLRDDIRRIRERLHVVPQGCLDLDTVFAAKGYGRGVGAKVGVAIAFKQRFLKSKKVSTSNWLRRPLSDRQILYAANDAYAAIRVFQVMEGKS